jgi:hypothetical protein
VHLLNPEHVQYPPFNQALAVFAYRVADSFDLGFVCSVGNPDIKTELFAALQANHARTVMNDSANNGPADCATNKDWHIGFGDDCIRQAQQQSESEADKPPEPGWQLYQCNHYPDTEPATKRRN